MTVDGQACASMEQKDKILKSYNENNVALSFDEVANANQARNQGVDSGQEYRVHLSQSGGCKRGQASK